MKFFKKCIDILKTLTYYNLRTGNVYENVSRTRRYMATIKDIARISGYSIGTVSRVINHRPDVSEKARLAIEKVIRETNFQPNANAKLLKQTSLQNISILIKGNQNMFLAAILEEMQKILMLNGEEATVDFLDETEDEVATAAQLCGLRKPKGFIFLGGNTKFFLERFAEITVPAVLTGDTAEGLPFENLSSFATDDTAGARAAMQLLLDNGHSRIGIIGGSEDLNEGQVGTRRLQSAMDVLAENHISFDPAKQYMPCRFSADSGYRAAGRLLEKNRELTALFALSDNIAIGALRAINDAGLKVPDDISLIGYDGIQMTDYMIPRLATIRQDTSTLARKSVEDLLYRLNYQRPAVHRLIPFRVIPAESIRNLKEKEVKSPVGKPGKKLKRTERSGG